MEEIIIVYFGLTGLVLGSFLNVVIYRLPLERSVITPPSACPACNTRLKFYENIPVISFILQKGKCRNCKNKISIQYPLVELSTGIIFLLCGLYIQPIYHGLATAIFLTTLLALAIIDFKHMILPNEMTVGGGVIFLIYSFFNPEITPLDGILAALSGVLAFTFILLFYLKVRKIEGLGWGDVKMMLLLGGFLGLEKTVITIMVASVSGLIFGLILMLIKGKNLRTQIPFGTFLSLGAATSYIWSGAIMGLIQRLYL